MAQSRKSRTKGDAYSVTHRIYDDMAGVANALLNSQKTFGSEKLQDFAKAAQDYASSLTDLPTLHAQAVSASESIEALASYVKKTDIRDMAHDAVDLARRRPMLMGSVALAAGLIAARLATAHHTEPPKRKATKLKATNKKGAARKTVARKAQSARRKPNGSAEAHA